MKRLIFILIIIATLFASCIKNYDDGPFISFRSTSKLLLKKWRVEQFLVNSVDSTKLYNDSCGCDIRFDNPSGDEPRFHLNENCINSSKQSAGKFSYTFKSIQFIMYGQGKAFVIPFVKDSKWDIKRLAKYDCWVESHISSKNYFLKLKAM